MNLQSSEYRSRARGSSVFLVGSSFSGSTLLGSSLSDEKVKFFGELDRWAPFKAHPRTHQIDACTVCNMLHKKIECPVFGEIKKVKAIAAVDIVQRYLSVVGRRSGVVIDGSKYVDWLAKLYDNGLMISRDIFAIIVCRNPVAFSFSNSGPMSVPYWESAVSWRETYQHALRVLTHRRIPFIVVQYENIFNITARNNISISIGNLIGSRVKIDLNGSRENIHSLGGNLGSYINAFDIDKRSVENSKEFDENELWKFDYYKKLEPKESTRWVEIGRQNAVSLLSIPGIVDLCSILGYSIDDILSYF
jgi:hypothetical protein